MARVQITDQRIKIEKRVPGTDVYFGPLDSVESSSVLLTEQNLRKMGASPARSGEDCIFVLWVYSVVSGVEEASDLSTITLSGTYWDPVSRVANTLTVSTPGDADGFFSITFADTDSLTAGMYQFQIKSASPSIATLCSGWLEILPAIPS